MKAAKIDYRGSAALQLSTRHLELVATTAFGPRLISLKCKEAPKAGNLLLELPADEKRYHGYFLRGGHRLWHAPEDIVRSYQTDDAPLEVRPLPKGFALIQPVEPKTGLQKGIQVEIFGERTIKVTHSLRNQGLWSAECSPWAVTMLPPGGYGVLPLLPKGSHSGGDLLPTYTLIPWSFTDLSLPVWEFHRDFIGINPDKAASAQKLGISDFPGWAAYWRAGVTLVKYSRRPKGTVCPDRDSCFETFTNGQLLELETLGPLKAIEPGKSVSHVEFWTVLTGIPKPSSDAVFSRELAPKVNRWLANLPR